VVVYIGGVAWWLGAAKANGNTKDLQSLQLTVWKEMNIFPPKSASRTCEVAWRTSTLTRGLLVLLVDVVSVVLIVFCNKALMSPPVNFKFPVTLTAAHFACTGILSDQTCHNTGIQCTWFSIESKASRIVRHRDICARQRCRDYHCECIVAPQLGRVLSNYENADFADRGNR
jgi:hypothetical protein